MPRAIYGSERDQHIARSKVVLNMHLYDTRIFEIVIEQEFRGQRSQASTELLDGDGCDVATVDQRVLGKPRGTLRHTHGDREKALAFGNADGSNDGLGRERLPAAFWMMTAGRVFLVRAPSLRSTLTAEISPRRGGMSVLRLGDRCGHLARQTPMRLARCLRGVILAVLLFHLGVLSPLQPVSERLIHHRTQRLAFTCLDGPQVIDRALGKLMAIFTAARAMVWCPPSV